MSNFILNNAIFDSELLKLPLKIKKDLKRYCEEVIGLLKEKVISVNIIGSAITTDFAPESSDVNILFIFSELNLSDLEMVSPKVNQWWQKHRFSARFISRRNLLSSLNYFPIDFWAMQEKHYVIFGQDLLKDLTILKKDLLWQLLHEIKGLRMRVKQQFWRTSRKVHFAKISLYQDFNTITYLLKVILFLRNISLPQTLDQLINEARSKFKIENNFAETMLAVKKGNLRLQKENIVSLFNNLLDLIRRLDDIAGEITI